MGAAIRIPEGRHHGAVQRVCGATLDGPGCTGPELRRSVAAHAAELWSSGHSDVIIPDPLRPYVRKVALESYKVVDEDVDALREDGGLSEDEILEVTLASALGCALSVLDTGTRLAQRS
jgi:hypothetical protein